MKALLVLALVASASPAFAEKQSAPTPDQKPFMDDRLMPRDFDSSRPGIARGPVTEPSKRAKVYDSARKQVLSPQPIITPYSPDRPSK